MGRLDGKRIAVLATDGFEQSELISPKTALEAEGAQVDVVSPHEGEIRGWNHKDWGENVRVSTTIEAADVDVYDALMLPGGVMNPDQLRANPSAVEFVRHFVGARKPIAAICHGPWTLIETGALEGRKVTSYASIKTDLINAGALWSDAPFVVDRGLVTSRKPDDLPVFNEQMIALFEAGPVPEEKVAPRPKRKKGAASTGARGRKVATHTPRGSKQPPRLRAPKRR